MFPYEWRIKWKRRDKQQCKLGSYSGLALDGTCYRDQKYGARPPKATHNRWIYGSSFHIHVHVDPADFWQVRAQALAQGLRLQGVGRHYSIRYRGFNPKP